MPGNKTKTARLTTFSDLDDHAKTVSSPIRDSFKGLLALLKAIQLSHLTSHWQAKGPTAYQDHLLFERIYGGLAEEIDTLAEKMVGKFGPAIVDAADQANRVAVQIAIWETDENNPIVRALWAEENLQSAIKNILDNGFDLSTGMTNFLQGLADTHETNLYLLNQRNWVSLLSLKTASTYTSKLANTNQAVVEHPHNFHPVKLEPPQIKRKEFPFEGFIDFQGIPIDIENAKGSLRSGTTSDGKKWQTKMFAHYGEIRNKINGVDGDKLDVYVGDNHDSGIVVVIHQHNPWDGQYDEDKIMLGFNSIEEAIGAYKKQYDKPGYFKPEQYTAMPIGKLWRWIHDKKNDGKRIASMKRVT